MLVLGASGGRCCSCAVGLKVGIAHVLGAKGSGKGLNNEALCSPIPNIANSVLYVNYSSKSYW